MPMIWYSIEALKLTKTIAVSLDNSVNMALSKIFNTYDSAIISEVRVHLNIDKSADINKNRSIKFLNKLMNNNNELCDLYKYAAYYEHSISMFSIHF